VYFLLAGEGDEQDILGGGDLKVIVPDESFIV
jgi:hypothetical protein